MKSYHFLPADDGALIVGDTGAWVLVIARVATESGQSPGTFLSLRLSSGGMASCQSW